MWIMKKQIRPMHAIEESWYLHGTAAVATRQACKENTEEHS